MCVHAANFVLLNRHECTAFNQHRIGRCAHWNWGSSNFMTILSRVNTGGRCVHWKQGLLHRLGLSLIQRQISQARSWRCHYHLVMLQYMVVFAKHLLNKVGVNICQTFQTQTFYLTKCWTQCDRFEVYVWQMFWSLNVWQVFGGEWLHRDQRISVTIKFVITFNRIYINEV